MQAWENLQLVPSTGKHAASAKHLKTDIQLLPKVWRKGSVLNIPS